MEETLVKALKDSGKIIRENFGQVTLCEKKDKPSQILTETDLASEKMIIKIIKEKFPDHNIISEETGFQNKDSEYTWIIDPLDGTSNFVAGLPWFGVIIAVFQDDFPILGGIYLPMTDDLYFVKKGFQTTKNGEKIFLQRDAILSDVLFSYSLDNGQGKFFPKLFGKIVDSVRNIRSTNSVLDFCYVMDNKFGGCINLNTNVWDIGAPSLLLKNAGAEVGDLEGKPIVFDLEDVNKSYSILVSNRIIHPEIVELIKEQ